MHVLALTLSIDGRVHCTDNFRQTLQASDSDTHEHGKTYMAHALFRLLHPWQFAHIGPISDSGLKAASPVIVPPHFADRARWVVSRCAGVAGVVPLSSHFREQGQKRIAYASFVTRAAWTAVAHIQGARPCLPSVRPPLGTAMADPVAHFVTSASDYVGVQAFFGVQL